MTPHDLLAAFETLAEAPDGITRLRELVLQLAVRGKLVPQDPNDEPACVLLERIAVEKAKLVKEGKLLKPKRLLPVGEDEVPFKVPAGWAWCRLDELLVEGPTNGWSPKAVDFETPTRTLRLSATTRGTFDGSYFKYVDTALAEGSPLWLRYSDLLIQRSNTPEYVGIAAIYDGEDGKFIYPDLMMRCRVTPTASVRFVHLALISPIGRSWFHGKASGTSKSMVKVSQTVVSSTPIPLPPIAEQHRIVAKVDTLMALLDRLEAARSERETTRASLRNAALAALREALDAGAVGAAWTLIAERMDDLFTAPADVAPLRQAILQLAIRGKLVPQDPGDEPACLLLERITAEKARLVKEGKLAKPKPLPPGAEDDMPFEVPSRWEDVRLNDLLIEDSRNGLSAQPNQGPPGIEILRISAGTARNDAIVMEEDHRFLELEEEATLTYELQRGDLLACRFNGNLHYVGRVAVYEKYSGHRQVYPDRLIRFRVHQSLINPWYIRLAMNCQGIRSVIERMCATTAGNIGISATNLKTVAIPIPPFEEQHRIVAKVDALMALCDALEARLAAAREAQTAFAAAAAHHLDT